MVRFDKGDSIPKTLNLGGDRDSEKAAVVLNYLLACLLAIPGFAAKPQYFGEKYQ